MVNIDSQLLTVVMIIDGPLFLERYQWPGAPKSNRPNIEPADLVYSTLGNSQQCDHMPDLTGIVPGDGLSKLA